MVDGEHNKVVQELSLANERQVTENTRMDIVKASRLPSLSTLTRAWMNVQNYIACWQRCDARGRKMLSKLI